VIGGSFGFGPFNMLNTVEAYDPSTDTWATAAPMPTARSGAAAVTGYDGKIYVIGGSQVDEGGEVFLGAVEVYDPDTNTWGSVAPLPAARSHLSAALGMDGRIYAIGGRDPTPIFLRDVTIYDPSAGTWSTAAPLLRGRYNLGSAVAIDGRIYVMGGFSEGYQYTNAVEVYDPKIGLWAIAPAMRMPREGLGAARGADDRIYAIGGLNEYFDGKEYHRDVLNSVEAYAP